MWYNKSVIKAKHNIPCFCHPIGIKLQFDAFSFSYCIRINNYN
nr:MAG TPA: hypothetical protein [Caudoviricetes sp.]